MEERHGISKTDKCTRPVTFPFAAPECEHFRFSSSQQRPSSLCSIYCSEYKKAAHQTEVIEKRAHRLIIFGPAMNRIQSKEQQSHKCATRAVENTGMSVTQAVNAVVIRRPRWLLTTASLHSNKSTISFRAALKSN